ncbi:hypothetical protein DFH09DRAFT_927382, partial [Mycena vulgaris]
LIRSSTNGYDGSMRNGFQSLPQWEVYFGFPTEGSLGLLGSIQARNLPECICVHHLFPYRPFALYFSDGIGHRPTGFIGAILRGFTF